MSEHDDKFTERIRAAVRQKAVNFQGLTGAQIDRILRGEEPGKVRAEAKPKRPLTDEQILQATRYMLENENCTWAEAQAYVRAEAEKAGPHPMDIFIRRAAGKLPLEDTNDGNPE